MIAGSTKPVISLRESCMSACTGYHHHHRPPQIHQLFNDREIHHVVALGTASNTNTIISIADFCLRESYPSPPPPRPAVSAMPPCHSPYIFDSHPGASVTLGPSHFPYFFLSIFLFSSSSAHIRSRPIPTSRLHSTVFAPTTFVVTFSLY